MWSVQTILFAVGIASCHAAEAFDVYALEDGALSGVATRNPSPAGCADACSSLHATLPGKVSFPQSSIYEFEESRYWSQQQATTVPTCRISPTCASDVSTTLRVLERLQCQFAVKSGGHAAFVGGSNINGGVTIDLVNMNEVTVSADRTQTSIGPGNRWADVYSKLDAMNLSVVGGRVADIGVGGLTLGGGISFFSGLYGLACDNVNNYEVVFADGTIHDVNFTSHPDLYFALRGGGNNFGIVTRFDLFTFPHGNMWGGSNTYSINASAALIDALASFDNAPDPNAAVILAYVYVQAEDTFLAVGEFEYALPIENPPALQNFAAIPTLASTMRITNLTDLTLELNASNPGGFRQTYWTAMFKNDAVMMTEIVDIYMDEVTNIKNATGVLPTVSLQPFTKDLVQHFSKNGGNALGISLADGPLTIINIAISWSSPDDDVRILAAARNMVNRSNATAISKGLENRFIYQNYASQEQDVFDSYGQANKARLEEIHARYDPGNVFTKLQPGYFKI